MNYDWRTATEQNAADRAKRRKQDRKDGRGIYFVLHRRWFDSTIRRNIRRSLP